jgi:hypothetical protein
MRPLLKVWGKGASDYRDDLPRPKDDPRAHASGVDSDRVLLFGTADSVGWGVLSHDLALPGMLARALTQATGRGTDVDVIANVDARASTIASDLLAVNLWRYDAIVLTVGLLEAVQLESIQIWVHDLGQALDVLAERGMPDLQVYILGTHSAIGERPLGRLIEPILARHLAALNSATAELGRARENVTFIPVEPLTRSRAKPPAGYRQVARMLAASMRHGLNLHFAVFGSLQLRDERAASASESDRRTALDAMHLVESRTDRRFDAIVDLARRAFGTKSAALSVVSADRTWAKSIAGSEMLDAPRDVSICTTTIRTAGALVVRDVSTDSRFGYSRLRDPLEPIRFYAGFPVEAPNGERIGALCVFDPETRDVLQVDQSLLRDFALMAQAEYWLQNAS